MKNCFLYYIILFLFLISTISSIAPYPIFSRYTNQTQKQVTAQIDIEETEIMPMYNDQTPLSKANWQTTINQLLEFSTSYEIIDTQTQETYSMVRIGGKNHADMLPTTAQDFDKIKSLYAQNAWDHTRHPILLKINDSFFLPASLCAYPHGYSPTALCGHFCIYFKGSKTDKTNKIDISHTKAIKLAEKQSKSILKSLNF